MSEGPELINSYSDLDRSLSKMYEIYDNEVGDGSYKAECASFMSTGGDHKNNNVIFCKKLLRNTSSFDNLGNGILSDIKKRCYYLNIWLNDQLVNNNNDCNVVDNILSESEGNYKNHCTLYKYKNEKMDNQLIQIIYVEKTPRK
ncbi:Plasmodium vivax Vir protein, putative [Plasmodium vivax]|uniref:Vir protein, putative n=1 Tax=Plasmodium vivax TaxID=5855 RepID=A0A1G4GVU8_PLAVI|nr:Plasmodium vivax Vir protein, putative [Plasmodium vivax]